MSGDDEGDASLHEGWLSIQNKRFYFVLYKEGLEKFPTEEDSNAGTNGEEILLESIENVDVIGDTAFEFEFADGVKWELQADSPENMDIWLDALEPLFTDDLPPEEDPQQNRAAEEAAPESQALKEAVPERQEAPQQLASTVDAEPQVQASDLGMESGKVEQPASTDQGAAPAEAASEEAAGWAAASASPAAPKASPSPAPAAAGWAAASGSPAAPKASPSAAPAAPAKTLPAVAATSSGLGTPPVRQDSRLVDPRVTLGVPSKFPAAEPANKAAPAQQPTVKITVVGAIGSFFKRGAPKGRWITVEVPSKPGRIFRTPAKTEGKPTWNHEIVIKNYQSTDLLHISVVHNHQIIGYCDLETIFFYPTPFEGDLDLLNESNDTNLKNGKLKVRISGISLELPAPEPVVPSRRSKRPVAQVLEAKDDSQSTGIEDGDSGAGRRRSSARELQTPTAEMHMPATPGRGVRGAVRIIGTVYDGDDGQFSAASRTPVESVVDDMSERELGSDEEMNQAHQTFSLARYRGKYQNLARKIRLQGDDKQEVAEQKGAGFYKNINPKLMWAVDGKAVKKWECSNFIHKQMTLHGLIAQSPNVRVNVVRLRGMRSNGWALRWDGECRCHVRGPDGQVCNRFSTGTREDLASTMSTTPWNHEAEVVLDSSQDSLEFTINGICKDSWPKKQAILGRAILPSHRFLSRGFSGEVKIEGNGTVEAYLYLVVAVLRIWDEELNMEVPPQEAAEILKRASKADSKILAPDNFWPSKPTKDAPKVKITTHDMLHFDAMRRNLDSELQRKMIHQTMTTPFRRQRWMWEEVDNVLMREVYGASAERTARQPLAGAKQQISSAVRRTPQPRLEFSTAHVFEEGDADMACAGPALDKDKHYLVLNEDYSEGSSETFDNNAVESSSESADEAELAGEEGPPAESKRASMAVIESQRLSALGGQAQEDRPGIGRQPSAVEEEAADKAEEEQDEEEEEEEEEAEKDREESLSVFIRNVDDGQARIYLEQKATDGSGEPEYADLTQIAEATGIRPEDLTLVNGSQLSEESVDFFMASVGKLREEQPSLKFPADTTTSLPSSAFKEGSIWAKPGTASSTKEEEEEEEEEEEDLEEQEDAATAIQAKFRQRQAKKEVARRRQEKENAKKSEEPARKDSAGSKSSSRSLFGMGRKSENIDRSAGKRSSFFQDGARSWAPGALKRPSKSGGMMSRMSGFLSPKSKKKMEIEEEDRAGRGSDASAEGSKSEGELRSGAEEEGSPESDDRGDRKSKRKQTMIDLLEEVVEIPGRPDEDQEDEEEEDLDEQEQAAIVIQAKVRQKQAKKEVEKRKAAKKSSDSKADDKKEEDEFDEEDMEEREEAALAIQAKVRQRQAKKEVEKRRQEKEAEDKKEKDRKSRKSTKKKSDENEEVEGTKTDSTDRKSRKSKKKKSDENEEVEDTKADSTEQDEDDPELEQAAIAIQSKVRQKQAKKEVEKRRQSKSDSSRKSDKQVDTETKKEKRRTKKSAKLEKSPEHFSEPPLSPASQTRSTPPRSPQQSARPLDKSPSYKLWQRAKFGVLADTALIRVAKPPLSMKQKITNAQPRIDTGLRKSAVDASMRKSQRDKSSADAFLSDDGSEVEGSISSRGIKKRQDDERKSRREKSVVEKDSGKERDDAKDLKRSKKDKKDDEDRKKKSKKDKDDDDLSESMSPRDIKKRRDGEKKSKKDKYDDELEEGVKKRKDGEKRSKKDKDDDQSEASMSSEGFKKRQDGEKRSKKGKDADEFEVPSSPEDFKKRRDGEKKSRNRDNEEVDSISTEGSKKSRSKNKDNEEVDSISTESSKKNKKVKKDKKVVDDE